MYFICADGNTSPVKYYFAGVSLPTEGMPPCGDVLIPPELWEDRVTKASLQKNRRHWGTFALIIFISMLLKNSFEWWSFLVLLAFCALITVGCPFVFAHAERKEVRRLLKENDGRVPRVSRSVLSATRPTTEEVLMSSTTYLSTGAQKRTLWMSLLLMLILALLFTFFACAGIPAGIGSLMSEGFSGDWFMDGGVLLLAGLASVPIAVAAYVATFKELKKIYSLWKKK